MGGIAAGWVEHVESVEVGAPIWKYHYGRFSEVRRDEFDGMGGFGCETLFSSQYLLAGAFSVHGVVDLIDLE